MTTLPYPPPFQDLRTLAKHTCLCETTIETLVRQGRFPQPRKDKCGKRLWVWREVEQFLGAPDDREPADDIAVIREATKRLSHA